MTSRERVLAVFRKEIPDRIPVWCGASPEFIEKSAKYLGVNSEEEVLVRFRDDFRRVYSRYAGPEKFDPVKNAEKGSRLSIWGVERKGEGYGVPANTPLKDATLEDVENYPWPSPDWIDVSHIREDALKWKGQYAIMGGEWCPFFHDLIDLLGMEDALIMMYEEPEVVHAVLDHIVDYYYECNKRIYEAAADVIDIAFMGNDMGSQTGPMVSVPLFEEFFAPHFKRLCDLAHSYGLYTQMHVCGSFQQLIPSMIACGLDAVQSLQPVNEGMSAQSLKENFGGRMIFNGGIDSVNKLIYGTKGACIEETKRVVSIMKPNGGYILSPSHDYLLEMTPVENVLAMYDTCYEIGAY